MIRNLFALFALLAALGAPAATAGCGDPAELPGGDTDAGAPSDGGLPGQSDASGDDRADGAPAGDDAAACGRPFAGPVHRVAPDGEDTGDCTGEAPCRTLQYAAEQAREPGSLVRVAAGTYRGFRTLHPEVAFVADGEVVIEEPPEGSDDAVRVEGTDGVAIDGLTVRGAPRAGIAVIESADVSVCSSTAGPNGRWGIFTQYAPRIVIESNRAFGSEREHGIYVSNSYVPDDAPVIRGNLAEGNGRNGIQLNGDCLWPGDGTLEDAVIEGNVVRGNGAKGLSIIAAPGALIANNIIHDNGPSAGGIHMTNEPGCPASKASSGGAIVNNTVVEPEIAALRATDGATDNIAFNNILVSPDGVIDEVGGNRLGENLVADQAGGLFGADFTPAPGSPARDAGVESYLGVQAPRRDIDGTARPQGPGIDLGAREAVQ